MSYKVSSRKYRPQTFSDILGQQNTVQVLKNALLLKRAAHAYIFSGTRGTGKTTLARLFAKALNCPFLNNEAEPCNSCPSCQEITKGQSLDVIEIDGASHRGIEDIRQINETMIFAPVKGPFKVYIIDEVHMLTKEAFNALLKTLEEPPSHVKFFLATTESHKIPSTISSRCQQLQLKRIPESTILSKLQQISETNQVEASPESLRPIAIAAQGSLRDAESLYDFVVSCLPHQLTVDTVNELIGTTSENELFHLEKLIINRDYNLIISFIKQLVEKGKPLNIFLDKLIGFYRDILLSLSSDKTSRYHEIASSYNESLLLDIIDFLGESSRHFNQTIFEQTFIETLLIRLVKKTHSPVLSDFIAQLKTIESHLHSSHNYEQKLPQHSQEVIKEVKLTPKKRTTKANPSKLDESQGSKVVIQEENVHTKTTAQIDTLLQFAAVEFSGIIIKE